MKYELIGLIRSLGLLRPADMVKFWQQRLLSAGRNRRFRAEHPGFAVPPYDLAFDAYNHVDWEAYRDSGIRHAEVFARIIRDRAPDGALKILEWGCGPGRLIRHLEDLLPTHTLDLSGTDYNPRTIAWCKQHLPGMKFALNDLMPPLPFGENRFDVVYTFSVFTHLSEETQLAWAHDLWRVLKPGGILICTTHGDNYRYLLVTKEENRRFDQGEIVVQGKYREGRKWYFAIHPKEFVRDVLLRDFTEAVQHSVSEEDELLQDVWIARK